MQCNWCSTNLLRACHEHCIAYQLMRRMHGLATQLQHARPNGLVMVMTMLFWWGKSLNMQTC
jgi:hypothetical protein